MKKDTVIKVEKLSKRYSIGKREKYLTLRDRLVELPKTIFKKNKKKQDFWALKDISFEVKRGEVLGIIGRNGAGKSTLLKILSRITEPTSGKVTMKGKVASMLEVGTGFNPELTGRENIYLNGAILGMSKSEIRSKFNQITEFAGIGKFLDTPVKRYSSGMHVRLAFAVAAHLNSDILIVDEVLAVGDADFQKKCLDKMSKLAKSGRTVMLVSHNLDSIRNVCSKGMFIDSGKIVMFGDINKTLNKYLSYASKHHSLMSNSIRRGNGDAKFSKITVTDIVGKQINHIGLNKPFKILLDLRVFKQIRPKLISITFVNENNQDVMTTFAHDNLSLPSLLPGKHKLQITIDPNPFLQGTVRLRLACFGSNLLEYDHVFEALTIEIRRPKSLAPELLFRPGIINIEYEWKKIS